MLGLGLGLTKNNIVRGGGVSYDTNYQAVLDYATAQGYTLPSDSQKLLQNQLMIDLKASGVWAKLDTFANFATDGSRNFALIDWKRLTQYTAVNSPTFTINEGFTGNGSSSFINTNFNPATSGSNYKLNDASRFLFMFTASSTGALDGVENNNGNRMFRDSISSQRINTSININTPEIDFTASQGMKSIHRTSSTNIIAYNNLSSISATQNSDASLISLNQVILRAGSFYGAHEISMYAMGSNLVSKNTAFVNAYNTYINSL